MKLIKNDEALSCNPTKDRLAILNRIHKRFSTFEEYNQIWDAKFDTYTDEEFREHVGYVIHLLQTG